LLDQNNFIAIGKIVKPFGIKGILKAIYLTDFPDRFKLLKKVFLFDEEKNSFVKNYVTGSFEFLISEQIPNPKFLKIGFEGFNYIEDSKKLVNLIIMIDEKQRVKIEKDNFYFYEIIGADVYDKDKLIGKVKSVVNYGSGDLFNIDYNGKEVMIPNRKEFILRIDEKEKKIYTDLIDGFLDL